MAVTWLLAGTKSTSLPGSDFVSFVRQEQVASQGQAIERRSSSVTSPYLRPSQISQRPWWRRRVLSPPCRKLSS